MLGSRMAQARGQGFIQPSDHVHQEVEHSVSSRQPTLLPSHGSHRRPRVGLYSHDTQGLGHIRRNLSIAHALASSANPPDILMLSGARELQSFALPPATDCVTLPALRKDVDGCYASRALQVSLPEIVRLRAATLHAAIDAFDPDVLIVDKVARGAFGELEPALQTLSSRGQAKVVLGLRDVLDEALAASREWENDRVSEAVDRYYDHIWVYGDRRVYDPVLAYELPDSVARKITFTGYLGGPDRLAANPEAGVVSAVPDDGYVLCTVGGGQDGYALASAFVDATMPTGAGILLCGPYMPEHARQELERRAAVGRQVRVLPFVNDPGPLIAGADALVGMGGYNTAVEMMACEAPALIVPRVRPRLEQLVRAERLAALGLVDMLHPRRLSSDALSSWLVGGTARRRNGRRIDFGGLDRVPVLFEGLVNDASTAEAMSLVS